MIHVLWCPGWTRLAPRLLSACEKYCHNGGMAFAHEYGSGEFGSQSRQACRPEGSMNGITGPHR